MESGAKESSDNKTAKVIESTDETEHPWNALETVTTFDRGNNMQSTVYVQSSTCENKIVQHSPSTSILIVSLIQQLCYIYEKDKERRNNLYTVMCNALHELNFIDKSYCMMEFEAVRGQYQTILHRLVTVARDMNTTENALQVPSNLIPECSYYNQQFEEISFIAKGGFGKVFKAKHRLDGIDYAIKKIIVHCTDVEIIMQHLREVKTLAKLNHPNIVPYKVAWIESTSDLDWTPDMKTSTFVTSTPSTKNKSQRSCVSRSAYNMSDSLQFNKDLCNNMSNLNINESNNKNISSDNEMKYPETTSSTRFDQESSVNNDSTTVISHDSYKSSYKFDLSTNIKKHMAEESSSQESSSDVVSFRNSEDSKELQTTSEFSNVSCEESTLQDYVEGSSSDVVSFRNSEDSKEFQTTSEFGNVSREESTLQEYVEESSSDVVSFRNSEDSKRKFQITSDTESISYEESSSNHKVNSYVSKGNHVTLYIQMALCDQTLEQWLRKRETPTPQQIIVAVYQQILQGLNYIHKHGIVHHDIKPSNIFITLSGQPHIYLGDFGLACPLQREFHSVVGTRMYAAPEQLNGKCDFKSDIYSVGIILIELLVPMKTVMELNNVVQCLKEEKVPEAFIKHQKWVQLIMQLIQEDPTKRPCTTKLLQDLNTNKDLIAELVNNLRDKDNIIQDKDSIIYDKDNMIKDLQDEITILKEEISKLTMSPKLQ